MKALAIIPIMLALSGCVSVSYESAGRKVHVWRCGLKTEIGELEATTPEGAVKVHGYRSSVEKELAEALKAAVSKLP